MKVLFITLEQSGRQILKSLLDEKFFNTNKNQIYTFGMDNNYKDFIDITSLCRRMTWNPIGDSGPHVSESDMSGFSLSFVAAQLARGGTFLRLVLGAAPASASLPAPNLRSASHARRRENRKHGL